MLFQHVLFSYVIQKPFHCLICLLCYSSNQRKILQQMILLVTLICQCITEESSIQLLASSLFAEILRADLLHLKVPTSVSLISNMNWELFNELLYFQIRSAFFRKPSFPCHQETVEMGLLLGNWDRLSLRCRKYQRFKFMHDNSTYWGIFSISILFRPFQLYQLYLICTTRIKVCWVYPRRISHI